MPQKKGQINTLELTLRVEGRKTFITYQGVTYWHKTAYLKSLSYKDWILYVTDTDFLKKQIVE